MELKLTTEPETDPVYVFQLKMKMSEVNALKAEISDIKLTYEIEVHYPLIDNLLGGF